MNLTLSLLIILGLSLGGLLAALTSPKTQRRVMIVTAVLIASICVPQLWYNTAEWRLHNAPALTTNNERAIEKDRVEISKTLDRVKQAYDR